MTLKTMPKASLKNRPPLKTGKWFLPAILLLVFLWPATGLGSDPIRTAWQEVTQSPRTSVQFLEPALNHFIEKQRQHHINNATIYSLALLEMAAGDDLTDEVKTLLTTAAITISPDYSFPETALCKLLFHQSHYFKSLFSLVRSIKKFQTNPQENFYASTFFWFAAAFTPLALFFIVTLLMTIKYYRAFCEMGRIKLNRQGNFALLAVTAVASVVIIMVPAPLPGLLLLAIWISILATKKDAITSTLLLLTLLIVPLAYDKGMASLLALDSSFFKASTYTASGLYSEAAEATLRQPATNQSQLVLQLFSQAEAARLREEYAKARIFLEKIISDKIELGAVYNNLANLYLLQGKPEKTETLYLQAAKLEKTSGTPYYNLSQTYIRQSFDLEKSSQALEQAFKLSPALKQSLTNNKELAIHDNVKLIFMALPKNFYRRYADSQPGKDIFLPEFLSRILFPGAGSGLYFTMVLISLGGLIFLTNKAPSNRRVCLHCGRLFHPAREQKEKSCPSCRLNKQPELSALLDSETKTGRTKSRPLTLILTLAGTLLPGFYPFMTGKIIIAVSLLLPILLWLYNILICQTGIMELFPPSTAWLKLVLPGTIFFINIVALALTRYWHQRLISSRSNP